MAHYKVSHFGEDTCKCGYDGWPCPHKDAIEAAENEGMATNEPEELSTEEWVERMKKASENTPPPLVLPKNSVQTNHEELMELLGAIFVQLSRIYDTQMLLLPDETLREQVDLTHQRGELMGSPPTLKEDAWE